MWGRGGGEATPSCSNSEPGRGSRLFTSACTAFCGWTHGRWAQRRHACEDGLRCIWLQARCRLGGVGPGWANPSTLRLNSPHWWTTLPLHAPRSHYSQNLSTVSILLKRPSFPGSQFLAWHPLATFLHTGLPTPTPTRCLRLACACTCTAGSPQAPTKTPLRLPSPRRSSRCATWQRQEPSSFPAQLGPVVHDRQEGLDPLCTPGPLSASAVSMCVFGRGCQPPMQHATHHTSP